MSVMLIIAANNSGGAHSRKPRTKKGLHSTLILVHNIII